MTAHRIYSAEIEKKYELKSEMKIFGENMQTILQSNNIFKRNKSVDINSKSIFVFPN